MTSSLDPVTQALAQKVSERTGCEVLSVGEELLEDLEPMVKKKGLSWKDVAFMGKDGTHSGLDLHRGPQDGYK